MSIVTSPTVSIVLPCRNESKHIAACLRSILAQEDLPDGRGFEVLVADGMSDDGTRAKLQAIAAGDPRVRIIDNPERIVPTGLNAAIRAARGEIIIRMDAHTEYAPDYVRECVAVLEETKADNVGGPALTRSAGYIQRAIAAAFHSSFSVGGARFHNPDYEGELDTVPYGCWRRETLVRIGLFDEDFVRNQDDELNLRLIRHGGRVWQSLRIRSWYIPRDSLQGLFRQYFQYGYWKILVMRKHGQPASLRHIVPGLFAITLLLLAVAAPFALPARIGLAVLVGLYLGAVVSASLLTARRAGWSLLAILPIVFGCFHFGYGLGSLFGIWDFLIRRRAAGRLVGLTRG